MGTSFLHVQIVNHHRFCCASTNFRAASMTSQMLANLVERRLDRHEVVDAAADVVRHHQITRPRGGKRIARALHELHRLRQRQLQRECQPYHRPAARLIMWLRADGRKQLAVNLCRAVDFRIRAPRAVEVTEEQSAKIRY